MVKDKKLISQLPSSGYASKHLTRHLTDCLQLKCPRHHHLKKINCNIKYTCKNFFC